jgi:hypothetical protein
LHVLHLDSVNTVSPIYTSLVNVPDVSHRGWSPSLLVPRSKPHVRPSPLPIRRHDTSLLDLHLTVEHRLQAPHLQNISQETYPIHSFRYGSVSHYSTFFVDYIDNYSSQEHILTLCSHLAIREPPGSAAPSDLSVFCVTHLKKNTVAYENYRRIYVPPGEPLSSEPGEPLRVNILFKHSGNAVWQHDNHCRDWGRVV